MSAYIEINIKEDMPTVAEAMQYLQSELDRLRRNKYKCVQIVHGYGSTGKGGAICIKARQWLKAQEQKGKIKSVVYGEDFTIFNATARELKNRYAELEQLFMDGSSDASIPEVDTTKLDSLLNFIKDLDDSYFDLGDDEYYVFNQSGKDVVKPIIDDLIKLDI